MSQSHQSRRAEHVVVFGSATEDRLRRALEHAGFRAELVPAEIAETEAMALVDDAVDAVILAAPRDTTLALCRRFKARHQFPVLPVIVLYRRPRRLEPVTGTPDAWLASRAPSRDVVARVEELIRIRRGEQDMARLNAELSELTAENRRLYDRALRDAEGTAALLRELQHRVRNNLATIQALLVLERHRVPPRSLPEALDVAVARLRSMAALQDSLSPSARDLDVASLARSVARGALDVFGASDNVRCEVSGGATVPQRLGSALAIVLNELVTNTVKHASAHHLRIDVRRSDVALKLEVADDGRGLPPTTAGGSGLSIIRAVVRNELHGELDLASAASGGTRATLTVPLGLGV